MVAVLVAVPLTSFRLLLSSRGITRRLADTRVHRIWFHISVGHCIDLGNPGSSADLAHHEHFFENFYRARTITGVLLMKGTAPDQIGNLAWIYEATIDGLPGHTWKTF